MRGYNQKKALKSKQESLHKLTPEEKGCLIPFIEGQVNSINVGMDVFNKNMKLKIETDCSGIEWKTIAESLKKASMAYHEPEVHKRAFEASRTTVFIYGDSPLIGFGRGIAPGKPVKGVARNL